MENYMNDYQTMINDLNGASLSNNQVLIGPSTCCNWNETDLFNMGEPEFLYACGVGVLTSVGIKVI